MNISTVCATWSSVVSNSERANVCQEYNYCRCTSESKCALAHVCCACLKFSKDSCDHGAMSADSSGAPLCPLFPSALQNEFPPLPTSTKSLVQVYSQPKPRVQILRIPTPVAVKKTHTLVIPGVIPASSSAGSRVSVYVPAPAPAPAQVQVFEQAQVQEQQFRVRFVNRNADSVLREGTYAADIQDAIYQLARACVPRVGKVSSCYTYGNWTNEMNAAVPRIVKWVKGKRSPLVLAMLPINASDLDHIAADDSHTMYVWVGTRHRQYGSGKQMHGGYTPFVRALVTASR